MTSTVKARAAEHIDDAELLKVSFNNAASLVELEIDRLLPKNSSNLLRAMRYCCLDLKGKKIRPLLFLEVASILDLDATKDVVSMAAVIELIHVFSLIHDDLPAIDNDDFRRGEPSCHKKFDEATAILAGDALLAYSFDIVSGLKEIPAHKRIAIISELAKTIGLHGMIKGQYADIESKKLSLSYEDVLNIHKLKTGKLISFACEAPAIISNCSQDAKDALKMFSENFGLIFQITDDIIDFKAKKNPHECNIVDVIGINKTKELVVDLVKGALAALEVFGTKAATLKALVQFIANRDS